MAVHTKLAMAALLVTGRLLDQNISRCLKLCAPAGSWNGVEKGGLQCQGAPLPTRWRNRGAPDPRAVVCSHATIGAACPPGSSTHTPSPPQEQTPLSLPLQLQAHLALHRRSAEATMPSAQINHLLWMLLKSWCVSP